MLVWEFWSRAPCICRTPPRNFLTSCRDFWTASELRISSSTMASVGLRTSGEPAPKLPYLAALAVSGEDDRTMAAPNRAAPVWAKKSDRDVWAFRADAVLCACCVIQVTMVIIVSNPMTGKVCRNPKQRLVSRSTRSLYQFRLDGASTSRSLFSLSLSRKDETTATEWGSTYTGQTMAVAGQRHQRHRQGRQR